MKCSALLCFSISINPIPPCALGIVKVAHAGLGQKGSKKERTTFSISCIHSEGTGTTRRICHNRDSNNELATVLAPRIDRLRSFNMFAWRVILVLIVSRKLRSCGWLWKSGYPKYTSAVSLLESCHWAPYPSANARKCWIKNCVCIQWDMVVIINKSLLINSHAKKRKIKVSVVCVY